MNMTDRLTSLAFGPKPWLVTTTYADGQVRTLRQPREGMARNHAERESRKIGKSLINRETGETVCVVSVAVENKPE